MPRVAATLATACALLVAAAPVVHSDPTPPAGRELFSVQDRRIAELSGMTRGTVDGVVFAHQDAGRPATVHAIDPNGRVRLAVDVPGVPNVDWEDMAIGTDDEGRPALFVADIGDAAAARKGTDDPPRATFALIRFTEPVVELDSRVGVVPMEVDAQDVVVFGLEYADGAARNAESLAVQPGTNRVFVVNKVRPEGQAHLWIAPKTLDPDESNKLTRLAPLPVTGATGADFSPSGELLAVRNGTTAYLWPVGDDVAAAVAKAPVEVALPKQKQGESITFAPDGRSLLVGSEGREQPVWSVPLPDSIAPPLPPPDPEPARALPDERVVVVQWAAVGAGVLGVLVMIWRVRRRHP